MSQQYAIAYCCDNDPLSHSLYAKGEMRVDKFRELHNDTSVPFRMVKRFVYYRVYTPLEAGLCMWYVYVLKSKKNSSWYIGSTHDIRKRILRHNAG